MKIWAHSLVKNEAKWLWFSVTSVIDYVDKILLWDTGSTDRTIEIEKELYKKYPDKISLKQRQFTTPEGEPLVRLEMLDATDADWFIVLDGDEVWWKDSIQKITREIEKRGNSLDSIVVPMIYPVGDIFHRQEESAGHYRLAGKEGNFALRGVNRKIPGLSSSNPLGTWGWTDGEGKMIQDRDPRKIMLVDAPYMHFSLIPRASTINEDREVMKRAQKLKYEIGENFPKDYYYPEVFFKERPTIVSSPWKTMDDGFLLRAYIETPLRKIKRRIFHPKVGY